MLLYHINLGFPLVDPETDLLLPSIEVTPRDQEAERDLQDFAKITEPQPAYQEKVYYHQMGQDAQGFTYVAVINRRLDDGLGIYLKYKKSQLPQFVQWKMFG